MTGRRDFSYEVGDDAAHAVSPPSSPAPAPASAPATPYSPYFDSPNRDTVSPPPPPPPPHYSAPSHNIHNEHVNSSSNNNDNNDDDDDDDDDDNEDAVDASPAPPPPPHSVSSTKLPRLRIIQGQDSKLRAPSLPSTRSTSPLPVDRDVEANPYSRGSSRPHSQFLDRRSYISSSQLPGTSGTPSARAPIYAARADYSDNSIPLSEYPSSQSTVGFHDSPYHRSSQYLNLNPTVSEAHINPNNILDDGDDGFMPEPQRRSIFPLISRDRNSGSQAGTETGAASSSPGFLARLFGKKAGSGTVTGEEKSEWLSRQRQGKNRMRWVVGLAIGAVIVIAIVAGVIGGVVGSRHKLSSRSIDDSSRITNKGTIPVAGTTNNANTDTEENGDLSIHSSEIQALMNNTNLHKVFPAIDYTPWGTQYPTCLTYPPSPNNVTRDIAVLSQLTNTVRLYGTDCNQTEMVMHSIKQLELTNMRIWLGVWIDTNQATTERQIAQLYDILEDNKDDLSLFKGVIIGNEALYRAGEDRAQSEQELIGYLNDARSNFTTNGYDLPIATSDLGDNWSAHLVDAVDYVMSNIHPFFAGVTAEVAAEWTWTFWQEHDVVPTGSNSTVKRIISATGWPSAGGTYSRGTTGEYALGQSGAVASVANMNTFMDTWVCQALENGTDYFWFEAFDEPWKVVYNTDDQKWEDQWGLLDPTRKLKTGLTIPDCGGKTVS